MSEPGVRASVLLARERAKEVSQYQQLCDTLRTRLAEAEQKYEHDRGLFTQIVDDLFDGMECDASCDDYSHGETCPTTLGPEAVKRLREKLATAEQRGRATVEAMGQCMVCSRCRMSPQGYLICRTCWDQRVEPAMLALALTPGALSAPPPGDMPAA